MRRYGTAKHIPIGSTYTNIENTTFRTSNWLLDIHAIYGNNCECLKGFPKLPPIFEDPAYQTQIQTMKDSKNKKVIDDRIHRLFKKNKITDLLANLREKNGNILLNNTGVIVEDKKNQAAKFSLGICKLKEIQQESSFKNPSIAQSESKSILVNGKKSVFFWNNDLKQLSDENQQIKEEWGSSDEEEDAHGFIVFDQEDAQTNSKRSFLKFNQ